VFVAGSDRNIREIKQKEGERKNDPAFMANKGEWVVRYEEQVMFSQLIPSMNCRAFFAGVAEANKPGSIHLLKYPFEKISEI